MSWGPPRTREQLTALLDRNDGLKTRAAKELGVPRSTLYHWLKHYDLERYVPQPERVDSEREHEDGTRTTVGYGCNSLEDLARRFSIDMDLWDVVPGSFLTNCWPGPVAPGKVAEFHQAKARWTRRSVNDPVLVKRDALEEIASASKAVPFRFEKRPESGVMAEIAAYDIHVGKPGHVELGEAAFRGAVIEARERTARLQVDYFTLPLGNDFLHFDTSDKKTNHYYGRGATPQHTASLDYLELRRRGQKLALWAIDYLSEVAPVEVWPVPGNHDWATTVALCDYLRAWYRNDENVTVKDSTESGRQYVVYGNSLIVMTHGDKCAPKKLAGLVAAERPDLWGAARYREIHAGHDHVERLHEELPGVIIRRFGALSPVNRWEEMFGHLGSKQQCQTLVWSRDFGLEEVHIHSIERLLEVARAA